MTLELTDLPKFKPIEKATVGSQAICRPKPKDSDYDFLFLVSDLKKDTDYLIAEGWKKGGSQDTQWGNEWVSLKKSYTEIRKPKKKATSWLNHEVEITDESKPEETVSWIENFILTENDILFDKFVRACVICRSLNLRKKEDRIKVHQAIMYDKFDTYGILQNV